MKNIFIGLVLLVVGVVVAIGAFKEKQKVERLMASGQTTEGAIVEAEERSGRRGRKSYYIDVQYGSEPKSHRGNFNVTKEFYQAHVSTTEVTNPEVTVRFNPDNIAESIIEGGSVDQKFLVYVGPVLALVGLGILLFNIFRRKDAELITPA